MLRARVEARMVVKSILNGCVVVVVVMAVVLGWLWGKWSCFILVVVRWLWRWLGLGWLVNSLWSKVAVC